MWAVYSTSCTWPGPGLGPGETTADAAAQDGEERRVSMTVCQMMMRKLSTMQNRSQMSTILKYEVLGKVADTCMLDRRIDNSCDGGS